MEDSIQRIQFGGFSVENPVWRIHSGGFSLEDSLWRIQCGGFDCGGSSLEDPLCVKDFY